MSCDLPESTEESDRLVALLKLLPPLLYRLLPLLPLFFEPLELCDDKEDEETDNAFAAFASFASRSKKPGFSFPPSACACFDGGRKNSNPPLLAGASAPLPVASRNFFPPAFRPDLPFAFLDSFTTGAFFFSCTNFIRPLPPTNPVYATSRKKKRLFFYFFIFLKFFKFFNFSIFRGPENLNTRVYLQIITRPRAFLVS
jgi:hypothetical protein